MWGEGESHRECFLEERTLELWFKGRGNQVTREEAFQAWGWTAGTDTEEEPREGCTTGIFQPCGGTWTGMAGEEARDAGGVRWLDLLRRGSHGSATVTVVT